MFYYSTFVDVLAFNLLSFLLTRVWSSNFNPIHLAIPFTRCYHRSRDTCDILVRCERELKAQRTINGSDNNDVRLYNACYDTRCNTKNARRYGQERLAGWIHDVQSLPHKGSGAQWAWNPKNGGRLRIIGRSVCVASNREVNSLALRI